MKYGNKKFRRLTTLVTLLLAVCIAAPAMVFAGEAPVADSGGSGAADSVASDDTTASNNAATTDSKGQDAETTAPATQAVSPLSGTITPLDGAANAHGTYLQTFVGTEQLSTSMSPAIDAPPTGMVQANKLPDYDNGVDFACKPGAITKQRITPVSNNTGSATNTGSIVYLKTVVNWSASEPTPTTPPTLTLDKPLGATFTLGADTSTTKYIASVRGDQGTSSNQITASTSVTLAFKSSLTYDNVFNISYSYAYNYNSVTNATTDKLTTDVTPTLNLSDSSIKGDSLMITTACAVDLYPAMGVNSAVTKFNGSGGAVPTQDDLQPAATNVARDGSAYTYTLCTTLQASLPNQPVVGQTNFGNATWPKTATYSLTLPAEATVVSLPDGWTQATVDGQTVISTSSWKTGSYIASSLSDVRSTSPSFFPGTATYPVISYTAPPAASEAGGNAYVYSATVTGTWQDDTPFTVATSDINHVYTATLPSLNYSISAGQQVSSFQGGGLLEIGSYDLTYANSYLAPGDQENFRYSVSNNLTGATPSEVPLSDFTITIPFDNTMWDLKHFWGVTPDRFDTMTVTYSDSSIETFTVDNTLFDPVAGAAASATSGLTLTSTDPMSWIMASHPDTMITQLSFHAAPGFTIPVGASSQQLLCIMVTLRNIKTTGVPYIFNPAGQTTLATGADFGRTSVSMTVNAPTGMATNPASQTRTGASASVPIYATQADRPVTLSNVTSAINGVPAANPGVKPGDSFAVTATSEFYIPYETWNRRIPQPTLALKLPSSMSFDYTNAQVLLGYGATNNGGINNSTQAPNTAATRVLDPADYTVSVTSDGAYNYYAYTYTGAGNNGNPGYLSYNEDYALIIKGAITVADDAVAASVPLTLTTSTPAATATVSGTVTTNIVVPTILSANSAVQGDIDQSATIGLNVWKKDTGDVATLDDLNLAAVRNEGLLRQQVINNTSNAVSGDIYVLAPVGDFTPVLAAVPYATTVNGSASNPTAGTWYYTTDSTVALGSDLSTVTNWIAVTSSVPAGATAFKLSGVTAAPGDRVNLYFDYNIPTTAGENMVVRSHAQIDMVGFVLPSTNYAGFRISKPAYRVNYYKDSVGTVGDTATYLGASGTILKDGTNDLIAGDGITLAAGTTLTSGQLGAKRPAGYQSGVQQGSVPYTLLDATDTVADLVTGNVNIINVLYVPIADYVVSYDTNGGTYDGSTSIADTTGVKWADTKLLPDGASYDTSLIAPPTGYTFSNWRVTTGGPTATATASSTYGSLATDDTTMSITLTAQWAPITYTVVYQKNIVDTSGNALAGTVAGTTVTSTHTYNVARNLTANGYSLKGYTFAGWNTAVDGTGTVYTNAQSVINLASMQDAQIVLYAQWDVTTNNTLTFDPNGGKAGTVNQLTGLEYGQMLGAQSQVLPSTTAGTAPTRAGYVFQGWTTSASASAPDFSIANTVDWVGDKVVYAVWTPDNVNYKVENYLVNSDGATVKLADTISYQALTGSTVTASPRSYTGYDYKAGYTNGAYKEIKSGVVKADGSLVLKLYYVTQYVPPTPPTPPTPPGPDNLTVTFVNWDGTVLKIQVVPRGGDATAPAVPGRAGYIFTGWDRGYTNVQENIIVTALFKPIIPETPTTSTPGGGGGGGGGGGATISPANPPTSPGSGPGTMTITSGGAPLGSGHNWSLFSLMLSVAGVLMALLLLVYMPMRRRRFNEERNELERFGLLTDEAEDEINERRKRGRVARLLAVIVGAVTLIVWLILDWPLDNMVWINSHTFIVAILFIVNLALTALYNARKRKPDEWEDYRTANVK